jgi:electron transfer flavoprotein alpha subunit
MGTILVYVETRGVTVLPISFELLAAARGLAAPAGWAVEALVAAADPMGPAAEITAADRVLTVAHPALSPFLPEAHAAVLAAAIEARQPDLVLCGYTTAGLDLAPAMAVRTGRALAAYCRTLSLEDGRLAAAAQVYGGKLSAEIDAPLPAIASVVPGAFAEEAGRAGGTPERMMLPPPDALNALRTRVVEEVQPAAGGVDLTQAERILCVGRGIGEAAKIPQAAEVAALLGAELAGSRPIIDNGWLEKARQVGKSGTKVRPKLYVALGVSGAPEHLEGMARAELIVAVNSDAHAPIFGAAHFGTTVDLFELLPALAERLRAG